MAVKVHASDAPPLVRSRRHRLRELTLLVAEFQSDHKPLHLFALPALSAVLSVVRNAALCSVVAWAANWCYAQGNVFVRTPVREQSYFSFIAAQVAMFHVFSSAAVVMTVAHVLQTQYRRSVGTIAAVNRLVPSLWVCVAKLVKRTAALFSVLLVLIVLATYALSLAPASIRPLKLEFYVSCILNHAFVSQADLVARTILRQEATAHRPPVEVIPTTDAPQYQVRQLQSAAPPTRSTENTPGTPRPRCRCACSKSCRYFCWTFSLLGFVFVASIGVQLTRYVAITESQAAFISFTCASTLLKLGMQEVAKWSALRRNVRDIRLMCVALGVPTVLIDTQLRLAVQRLGSQQSTLAGTLLLALLEVSVRLVKVWFIKWQIFRREGRSVWQLYVAEVHVDMAAEYIAIGCSTSILFFYESHVKYALGGTRLIRESAAPSLHLRDHVVALVVQVTVELIVDIVATLLELRRGLDFRQFLKHTAFIVTFFVHLAIVNIHISSAVYLID